MYSTCVQCHYHRKKNNINKIDLHANSIFFSFISMDNNSIIKKKKKKSRKEKKKKRKHT